jgi:hypothetical protein
MKPSRLQWRLRSLVWLVLIAGVVLGLIRYRQDHAARTKPSGRLVYITIGSDKGLTPGTELVIYRTRKPSRDRAVSPKR